MSSAPTGARVRVVDGESSRQETRNEFHRVLCVRNHHVSGITWRQPLETSPPEITPDRVI